MAFMVCATVNIPKSINGKIYLWSFNAMAMRKSEYFNSQPWEEANNFSKHKEWLCIDDREAKTHRLPLRTWRLDIRAITKVSGLCLPFQRLIMNVSELSWLWDVKHIKLTLLTSGCGVPWWLMNQGTNITVIKTTVLCCEYFIHVFSIVNSSSICQRIGDWR